MNVHDAVSIAILAGGKARRFGGQNKAMIAFDGIPIVERVLNSARPFAGDLLAVADDAAAFSPYSELRITSDIFTGRGPLGGIHAALQAARHDIVLILACDLPLLTPVLLEELLEVFIRRRCQILIPRHGDKIEPLCAVYHKSILFQLGEYLKNHEGCRIRDFFPSVHTEYWDLPEGSRHLPAFSNVNSAKDLEKLIQSLYIGVS